MKRTCRHNLNTTKKSKVYYACDCRTIYYLDYSLSCKDIQQVKFLKMDEEKNCKHLDMTPYAEEMEKHENDINGLSPLGDGNLEKNCGKRKINNLNKIEEVHIPCNNELCNGHNMCCNNQTEQRVRSNFGDTGFPLITDGFNAHNIKVSDDLFLYDDRHQECPFACCQNKWKRECGEGNIEEVQRREQEDEIIKKEDNLEENACFYSRGNNCNISNTYYLEINAILKELHFSKLYRDRFKKKDDPFF